MRLQIGLCASKQPYITELITHSTRLVKSLHTCLQQRMTVLVKPCYNALQAGLSVLVKRSTCFVNSVCVCARALPAGLGEHSAPHAAQLPMHALLGPPRRALSPATGHYVGRCMCLYVPLWWLWRWYVSGTHSHV